MAETARTLGSHSLAELMATEQGRQVVRRYATDHLFFFARVVQKNPLMVEDLHGPLCEFLEDPRAKKKLILIPRGHLKCVSGDTRVHTNFGWQKIQDLQPGDIIHSCDVESLKNKKSKVLAIQRSENKKQMFEVITRSGKKIKTTNNHPFFQIDGWKELSGLRSGDRIAVSRRYDSFQSDRLNEDEAKFLGYMIGDGCMVSGNCSFTTTTLHQEFIQCIEKLGFQYSLLEKSNKAPSYRLKNGAREFLRQWQLLNKDSCHKFVPPLLFQSSLPVISKFIGAYFDCDGSVNKKSRQIWCGSMSERLIRGISSLLLYFGIQSRIYTYQAKLNGKVTGDFWVANISGKDNIQIFAKHIRLSGKKQDAIDHLNELSQNTRLGTTNLDTVPEEWKKNLSVSQVFLRNKGIRIDNHYGSSRDKISAVSKYDPSVLKYAESDVYWDIIESINPVEEDYVWDIAIEDSHCFYGNDFLLHNSTLAAKDFAAWQYVKNHDIRVGIFSSTEDKAADILEGIKRSFHEDTATPMMKQLFPECIVTRKWANKMPWSKGTALMPRPSHYAKENTFHAMSVWGSPEGYHFNVIILDDLIDQKTARSEADMTQAIYFFNNHEPLFDSIRDGISIVIGTRYGENDLYAEIQSTKPSYQVFYRSCVRDKLTGEPAYCLDDTTEPIYPLRFPMEDLLRLKNENPAWFFANHYFCMPVSEEDKPFKASDLRYYAMITEGHAQYIHLRHEVKINPFECDRIMIVDPASSREGSGHACDSAVVIIGKHHTGKFFILEAWAEKVNPNQLVDKMYEINDKWQPRTCYVEDIAFQGALMYMVDNKRPNRKPFCRLEPIRPGWKSKDDRIVGLEPYLRNHLMYIQIGQEKLKQQILRFQPGHKFAVKDLLDAVSYAPMVWHLPMTPAELTEDYAEEIEDEDGGEVRQFAFGRERDDITGY